MVTDQQLAFPDALGYGRFTQGGRGGQVYHVTTLADPIPAQPGSLRHAIVAKGPRIVVFDVAGTIELQRQLTITEPYITIAGQTAPGEGICLKNGATNMDAALSYRTHDVIISNIKSRPGPGGTKLEGPRRGDAVDALGNISDGSDVYNVYLRNCSASWSIDMAISAWNCRDMTVESCLMSEPLNLSTHSYTMVDPEIGHAKAFHAANAGTRNISLLRCVMAHANDRTPMIRLASGHADMVNCVTYNWGAEFPVKNGWPWVSLFADAYGDFAANIVGNFYKPGPNSGNRNRIQYNHPPGALGAALSVYLAGNIDLAEGLITEIYHDDPANSTLTYFDAPLGDAAYGIPLPAWEAYNHSVLAWQCGDCYRLNDLGQRVSRQDAVDFRILQEIDDGTGRIINDPAEVGGWPDLDPGQPLDWGPGDVPRAFAEHFPDHTLEDFLWR